MRSTGITRKLDELGRLVIPKEIRKTFELKEGSPVEFFVEGDSIIIKKYQPGCRVCNEYDGLREVLGIKLCVKCMETINQKTTKIMNSLK